MNRVGVGNDDNPLMCLQNIPNLISVVIEQKIHNPFFDIMYLTRASKKSNNRKATEPQNSANQPLRAK